MKAWRLRSRVALAVAGVAGTAVIVALAVASPGSGGVSAVGTCNTTLGQAASAGADSIMVANTTGCDIGDTIVVNQGGGTEECQEIESVVAGTPMLTLVGTLADGHSAGETVVEVAMCPTPTPVETETPPPTETPTPTPTPTPSPTATPTATATATPTPTPVAQVLGCPQGGKWSIAVWDAGADGAETDGADMGEALGTCGEGVVDAAYFLDPDSQMWRRWFPGHPEISNFESLKHNQGFIAHGSPVAIQRIAFSSDRDGNRDIYVMNADGSGQTNLTNDEAYDDDPAWSPDRSKIAWTRWDEIYVMNADGTGQTNLTNDEANDADPAWSPDGSKIAFMSDRDDNWEIYVMNADGTGQTRLTNNDHDDGEPDWSPDGSKIAFTHWYRIYVMNADGTGQTLLTDSVAGHPAWSPDGSKIAFYWAAEFSPLSADIYVMNADGTEEMRLTTDPVGEFGPTWSPGGSKIAFRSDWDGWGEIYVMNADGTGQTNLTNHPDDQDSSPAWAAPTPRFRVTPGLGARQVYNCPQGGKWSIAVWDAGADGADTDGWETDGADMGEALGTCGEEVDAAYFLDPDSQMWLRWFPGHPEISNFGRVKHKQGFIVHASLVSSLVARRDQAGVRLEPRREQ